MTILTDKRDEYDKINSALQRHSSGGVRYARDHP